MNDNLKMECPKCGNVEEIKINIKDISSIPSYKNGGGDASDITINLKLNKGEIVFPCGYTFEHEFN